MRCWNISRHSFRSCLRTRHQKLKTRLNCKGKQKCLRGALPCFARVWCLSFVVTSWAPLLVGRLRIQALDLHLLPEGLRAAPLGSECEADKGLCEKPNSEEANLKQAAPRCCARPPPEPQYAEALSFWFSLFLLSLSLSLSLSFARAMAKGKFPSLSLSPPRTLPLALTLTHVNLLPEDRTSNSGHSDYSPVPQSSGAQSPYHPEALLCKFPHSVPEVGLVGVVHSLAQGVHLRVFTLLSSVFGVMAQDSWAWCIGTNKRKIEFEILVLLKPYKPQTRNPNLRSHNPQPYADQCHPTANATHPCPNHDNV